MSAKADLKKQIAELKGKTEDEILDLMSEWSKSGQADNLTEEDIAKITEALDYAEKHGLSTMDIINKKMGYYKR